MKFQTLVINLERSTNRWISIERQMINANISNYERFPAFDGSKLTPSSIEYKLLAPGVYDEATAPSRKTHRSHSLGSIGCYLSHMGCWKIVVDRNLPFVLICEDDIKIDKPINDSIELLLDEAPSGWDIIHVGHHKQLNLFSSTIKTPNFTMRKFTKWISLSGYLVSAKGCRALLKNAVPIRYQVDWYASTQKLQVYGLKDRLFGLDMALQNLSEIQHTPVANNAPIRDDATVTAVIVITVIAVVALAVAMVFVLLPSKKQLASKQKTKLKGD